MKRNPQPLIILDGFIKKEFYNSFIEEYLYSVRNRIRLWKAVRLANSLKHQTKGSTKEYYVVDAGLKGLFVFNNSERKALVKRGLLSKSAKHFEIISICAYYTGWDSVVRAEKEQKEYDRLKTYLKKK